MTTNLQADVPPKEQEVLTLFESVHWERIAYDLPVPLDYGRYDSEVLLKIHLLPYLLPIKSERQLAFAVAEKDILRKCVGLGDGASPQRGTLWHFRKRNLRIFRLLVPRALAVIYIEAAPHGISLPFIAQEYADQEFKDGEEFLDQLSGVRVRIRYPLPSRLVTHQTQLPLPLEFETRPFLGVAPRLLLPHDIGFPLQTTFIYPLLHPQERSVLFKEPSWLNDPYGPLVISNHLEASSEPYTACNILVLRTFGTKEKVLLSKRLQGKGAGTYTLPGGKKRRGESVKACVRRELEEETGLLLNEARPISLAITKRTGYPRVRSIGVLSSARGEPRRVERFQHSAWEWYELNALPSPLFFPTERVLEDYVTKKFPDLTWDDIEDSTDLPLWRGQ